MRSILAVTILLLTLAAPAHALDDDPDDPIVEHTDEGTGLEANQTITESGGSGPGSDGGSNSGATGWHRWVDVEVRGEPGEECWGLVYTYDTIPPPEHREEQYWIDMLDAWEDNGVAYDTCPDPEPTFDPAAAALTYWQQVVHPPLPTAEVKPGHAMTGLPSYLEIGGEDSPSWTLDNPIGADIIITASPRYEIDWGDGSGITSTTSRGVPYPGGPGEIVHHYGVSSTYTIEVAAFWTGSWRLANEGAGAARSLPELPVPTTTDLPLEVRQVQAIRDR